MEADLWLPHARTHVHKYTQTENTWEDLPKLCASTMLFNVSESRPGSEQSLLYVHKIQGSNASFQKSPGNRIWGFSSTPLDKAMSFRMLPPWRRQGAPYISPIVKTQVSGKTVSPASYATLGQVKSPLRPQLPHLRTGLCLQHWACPGYSTGMLSVSAIRCQQLYVSSLAECPALHSWSDSDPKNVLVHYQEACGVF